MPKEGPRLSKSQESFLRARQALRQKAASATLVTDRARASSEVATIPPLPEEPRPEYKPPLSERDLVRAWLKQELKACLQDTAIQIALRIDSKNLENTSEKLTEGFLHLYDLMEERSYRQPADAFAKDLAYRIYHKEPEWQSTSHGRLVLAFLYEMDKERVNQHLTPDYELDPHFLLDERASFFAAEATGTFRAKDLFTRMVASEASMLQRDEFIHYDTPSWKDVPSPEKLWEDYGVRPPSALYGPKNFQPGRSMEDFDPTPQSLIDTYSLSPEKAEEIAREFSKISPYSMRIGKLFDTTPHVFDKFRREARTYGAAEEVISTETERIKKGGFSPGIRLTNTELFDIISEAGYTITNAGHLIGYARSRWSPTRSARLDQGSLERGDGVDIRVIHSLAPVKNLTWYGSPYEICSLREEDNKKAICFDNAYGAWGEGCYFLLFRG